MKRILAPLQAVILFLYFASTTAASVEWHIEKRLELGEPPVDVASTADGKMTFVLTENGNVFIYSEDGSLKDKIFVGKNIDVIDVSPKGDQMLMSSKKDKSVLIASLDFILDINTTGAPFKGPADAPVVIAVFSDFQ